MDNFQAQLLKQQHALPFTSPFAISSLTKKDIKEEDEQNKDAAGEKKTLKHQQPHKWFAGNLLDNLTVPSVSAAVGGDGREPLGSPDGSTSPDENGKRKQRRSAETSQNFNYPSTFSPQPYPMQYFVVRKYAHFQKIIYKKKIQRQFRKKSCEGAA